MSLVPQEAAEALTRDEAMTLIRDWNREYATAEAVAARLSDIATKMYLGRAWLAMECSSWDVFAQKFLAGMKLPKLERKQVHQELRQAGMSTRAIGAVTGASEATVRRDLPPASNDAPAPVTGLDGKTYSKPAPKPKPEPVVPDEVLPAPIRLPTGEELRPDSKDTARWGRGVTASNYVDKHLSEMASGVRLLTEGLTPDFIRQSAGEGDMERWTQTIRQSADALKTLLRKLES